MLTEDHLHRGTAGNDPADWRKWLENDNSLTPGLRESYQRTLAGFERFCLKHGAGAAPGGETCPAARPTVGLAREYVELQRLERGPGPAQLQEWKDALSWLFRCGRRPSGAVLTFWRR